MKLPQSNIIEQLTKLPSLDLQQWNWLKRARHGSGHCFQYYTVHSKAFYADDAVIVTFISTLLF